MVGTPPYQKRGKCGHWMPAFDKHLRCYSCRMHCKGEDPCASGAPLEACSSCSSLLEVEWHHLRTVFQEKSAKRASKNVSAEPEPDSEGELEAGEIDDSILDLNTEDQLTGTGTTGYTSPTGVSALTGLSPLQPASSSGGLQFVQTSIPPPRSAVFHTVPVSTTSAVFFKAPAPLQPFASQDPLFSAPDPQRLVPPPTPCTQMLKAHFERQNMQMMENLSQQNQKQMQDLSSQLQSGLQAFLASSMEQMFKKFSPAPSNSTASQPSVQAQTSQVAQTQQQTNQPVPTPPEPMDTSLLQTTIKKGLKGVKGSASIAPSTIKAIVSPPPPPTTQPQPQSESPLQRLEKGDYGLKTGSSYSSTSQPDESESENLAPPPKADFHTFID